MNELTNLMPVREILWKYGKTLRRRKGLAATLERFRDSDSINSIDKIIETEKKLEQFDKNNGSDIKRIERALSKLEKDQLEILTTRHIHNLSYETAGYRMWRKRSDLKQLEAEALREFYKNLMDS